MLHVVLLILKILGIILLVILGFLLLALYAVFFVAASYGIRIRREEEFQVSASASWCFQILTLRFRQDQETGREPRILIRLFGFPLWMNYEEPGKKGRRAGQRLTRILKKWWRRWRPGRRRRPDPSGRQEVDPGPEPEKTESREAPDWPEPEIPDRAESAEAPERLKPEIPDRAESPEDQDTAEERADPERPEPERKRNSFMEKLIRLMQKIRNGFRSVGEAVRGIWDMWRRFLERKDRLWEFWNLEEHRGARGALWKEAQYAWKKLRPRKIRGKIVFGLEDPAATGLCMGAAGMFCAWYPKGLAIIPDFEQKILKVDIRIRGKARFYVIARVLWRIYHHKEIRRMYQHWQEL